MTRGQKQRRRNLSESGTAQNRDVDGINGGSWEGVSLYHPTQGSGGSAVISTSGVWAELEPKLDLVHFKQKIWLQVRSFP